MDWFARAVKQELERKRFKVAESGHYAFNFISTNPKGKKVAVKCQPHGHVYAPQKKELLNLGNQLGVSAVYVASESYSDTSAHVVKLTELHKNKEVKKEK